MKVNFTGNKPQYMSEGAAGADLISKKEVTIKPMELVLVSTGTKVEIPTGFYAMLCPRSSLANKKNLMLANSVGIIDSDFRGDIKFAYRNIGTESVTLGKGERIGQLVVQPFVQADFTEADLSETDRGEGMFGSTGK